MFETIRRGLRSADRYLARRLNGANALLDERALGLGELSDSLQAWGTIRCELEETAYRAWVKEYLPDYEERWGHVLYKKGVELYISFVLLAIQNDHVFLDVAAGGESYAPTVRCARRLAQDLRFSPEVERAFREGGVELIESDAGAIPLPDRSVDRISVHHAIEHFQGDADSRFIREVQRLLRPGGRAAIVPLLVSDVYLEVTSNRAFGAAFDPAAERLVDPSATLPGGPGSGDFARIYDEDALTRRILSEVDLGSFEVQFVEVRMDGATVPDLSLRCHRSVARVNAPYRALLIKRAP